MNWVAPRAGTLTSLRVNVTLNTLAATATYTIRRSPVCNNPFVATALSISVGSGVTGCFVDTATQAIAPGDRISLQAVTGGVVGIITATAGLEVL